ncbi:glycosyltransferase family 4 protein [Pyrococcus kukulkanii]|uniref:glycosyltransferase family 4 protein n=1 Tax=Pyrococcus kukulkanii TaxID=1609559 RepID=UPI0035631716
MKILQVSNLYPPYILGGAEVYVRNISEELAKKGHKVIVITTSPNKKSYVEVVNNVKIYRINSGNLYPPYEHAKYSNFLKPIWHGYDFYNLYSYAIVRNIIKKERPDIVHIHNFKGLSYLVFKAFSELKIPSLFTAHDYSLLCPRANLLNRYGKICVKPHFLCKLYRRVGRYLTNNTIKLITAPSKFVLDMIQKEGFFKDIPAIKLPLGVEIPNKEPIEKCKTTIDILYVGNISYHKGVHILVEAFKKIKNEAFRLHIVGKGKDYNVIKKLAERDSRIIFHGFVPENILKELYQHADMGAVPSIWYDNSPMVIYEHFSAGNPVIGSKIGGIPELIVDGYNGILVKPGDINDIKGKIEYLASNTSKLKKMQKNAFRSIKKFDIKLHIKKLELIYDEMING